MADFRIGRSPLAKDRDPRGPDRIPGRHESLFLKPDKPGRRKPPGLQREAQDHREREGGISLERKFQRLFPGDRSTAFIDSEYGEVTAVMRPEPGCAAPAETTHPGRRGCDQPHVGIDLIERNEASFSRIYRTEPGLQARLRFGVPFLHQPAYLVRAEALSPGAQLLLQSLYLCGHIDGFPKKADRFSRDGQLPVASCRPETVLEKVLLKGARPGHGRIGAGIAGQNQTVLRNQASSVAGAHPDNSVGDSGSRAFGIMDLSCG